MDVQTVRATTLSLFAALLLLTACAPPQPGVRPSPVVDPSDPVATHLARRELDAAAALPERQAYSAAAEDRPQLLLRAAELRLDLEQIGRARALLAQVNEALLSGPARYRKALLEVRLLLIDGQITAAENRLALLAPPIPELRP